MHSIPVLQWIHDVSALIVLQSGLLEPDCIGFDRIFCLSFVYLLELKTRNSNLQPLLEKDVWEFRSFAWVSGIASLTDPHSRNILGINSREEKHLLQSRV
jgi:hypothetical protein